MCGATKGSTASKAAGANCAQEEAYYWRISRGDATKGV